MTKMTTNNTAKVILVVTISGSKRSLYRSLL